MKWFKNIFGKLPKKYILCGNILTKINKQKVSINPPNKFNGGKNPSFDEELQQILLEIYGNIDNLDNGDLKYLRLFIVKKWGVYN